MKHVFNSTYYNPEQQATEVVGVLAYSPDGAQVILNTYTLPPLWTVMTKGNHIFLAGDKSAGGDFYLPQYQAVLDYATAQGFTQPSQSVKDKQNTFLAQLLDDAIWGSLDLLYVTFGDGDADFAKINWKAPGTFQLVGTGHEPTYTVNAGFKGNGTSMYLDTGWSPGNDGVNYTRDNASAFASVLVVATVGANAAAVIGAVTPTQRFLQISQPDNSGDVQMLVNQASTSLVSGITRGLWHGRRIASNAVAFFFNGVQQSGTGGTTVSGLPPTDNVLILARRNNGSIERWSNAEVSLIGFGNSLSGKEALLNAAWENYKYSIIAPENIVAPALSGIQTIGDVLTCSTGTWRGSPSFTYSWLRDGSPIAGAGASTYTLVQSDLGKNITCTVTATTAGGSVQVTANTIQEDYYQQIIAFSNTNGGTLPSVGIQARGKILIRDLMQTGAWYNLSAFVPFYTDGDLIFSRICWRRLYLLPTAGNAANIVFTPLEGVNQLANSAYFQSNISGSNIGWTYTSADQFVDVTVYRNGNITAYDCGSNDSGGVASSRIGINGNFVLASLISTSGTEIATALPERGVGLWHVYRRESSGGIVKNGITLQNPVFNNSGIGSRSFAILCRLGNTTPADYSSNTVGLWGVGMDVDPVALADAWIVYKSTNPPINTVAPTLSGRPGLASVLTCAPGTWSNSPTFSYEWLRDGIGIIGAAASTYTLVAADYGKQITCRVAATAAGGTGFAITVALPGYLEYKAVKDYAISQTFTLPSAAQQQLGIALIYDLITDAIWSGLDLYYVMHGAGDANFAKINWKVPGTFQLNGAGHEPTYGVDAGFTGNGSSSYLDTGFNLAADGVNYTQNSACLFSDLLNSPTGGVQASMMGANSGNFYAQILQQVSGNLDFIMNSQGNASAAALNPQGFILARRFGSAGANQNIWKNGVVQAHTGGVGSTGIPTVPLFVLARNIAGTPLNFVDATMALFGIGGALTDAQVLLLYNSWVTYKANVASL